MDSARTPHNVTVMQKRNDPAFGVAIDASQGLGHVQIIAGCTS